MTTTITWARRPDGLGYTGQPGGYWVRPYRRASGKNSGWEVYKLVAGRNRPIEIGIALYLDRAKVIAERHAAAGGVS